MQNPNESNQPEIRNLNLKVSDNEGKTSAGTAELYVYSSRAAQKRALRAALISLGLAFASIFLPLAHFILVPFFLILSPILFFTLRRTRSKIKSVRGNCPHCTAAFELLDQPENWPQEVLCEKCRKLLKASPQ